VDADMACQTIPGTSTEACLLPCVGADDTAKDAFCEGVSSSLTCLGIVDLCVLKCGALGECPSGFACTGETPPLGLDPNVCVVN
jgi:hypothetical protein